MLLIASAERGGGLTVQVLLCACEWVYAAIARIQRLHCVLFVCIWLGCATTRFFCCPALHVVRASCFVVLRAGGGVHDPRRAILFREFQELLVRIAKAKYEGIEPEALPQQPKPSTQGPAPGCTDTWRVLLRTASVAPLCLLGCCSPSHYMSTLDAFVSCL